MLILTCSAPKGEDVFEQRGRIPLQQQILHQIIPNGIGQDSYPIPAAYWDLFSSLGLVDADPQIVLPV